MVRDHLLLILALSAFEVGSQKLKLVNHLVVFFQNEGQNQNRNYRNNAQAQIDTPS